MAKYNGTFSCGHEGKVNIIGPTKDREWKKERAFNKMCPECWEKHLDEEREKANKEAAEKAKEMELPQLTGSEKQVAWAITLRQNLINYFNESVDDKMVMKGLSEYYGFIDITKEDILTIRDYIIENKTDAKYYIDNRSDRLWDYIEREIKNAIKSEKELIEEKAIVDIKLESTVYPDNKITNVVAEITVKDDKVTVMFEKNEDFRQLVKSLGYKWEGTWERKITEYTGKAEDRAAELGNKLLNAGFPIMILDEQTRNNAINGLYEQECKRWIKFREKEKLLAISWQGRDDKLYKTARKLPGSKWSSPSVVVKIERYKEVEEFAQLYDFEFSKAALKAIEEYKEALKNVEVVAPVKVEENTPKDGLKEILNSSMKVLEDLKDD